MSCLRRETSRGTVWLSVPLALLGLMSASVLHAGTVWVEGNVESVAVTGDGRYGGCMAELDIELAEADLNCTGRWVTFSCTGEYAETENAARVFEALRVAVVEDKPVGMRVSDESEHGGYCHASRIKVQDDPHVDEDSDSDGVLDLDDDVPLDASETIDTDDDGIGNNADSDDDNDGVNDSDDAFPLDPSESIDTDGDGIGDNADTDDDNDGVLDDADPCPLDKDDTCLAPDLIVVQASVDDPRPIAGSRFTLHATVRNQGNDASDSTTVRYYRSTDGRISSRDTPVGKDVVGGLSPSRTSNESIRLTAPSTPATYFYGACVDAVDREAETENNCSYAVTVRVQAVPVPDLVVHEPTVDPRYGNVVRELVREGGHLGFRVGAWVQNRGDGESHSTTFRFYRSTDSTISSGDDEVPNYHGDSRSVDGLAPSASQWRSGRDYATDIRTSYYGFCVDPVSDEADTGNNCSEGVRVEVLPASRPPFEVRGLELTRWGSDILVRWSYPTILAAYHEVYRCQYRRGDEQRCEGDFDDRSVWEILATVELPSHQYMDRNVLASPTDEPLTFVYDVQACNSAGCTGRF